MGRKGVSKRKPKKSELSSKDNIKGSSNLRPGESSPVQSMVKSNGTALNRGGTNPATGSNQRDRRGK